MQPYFFPYIGYWQLVHAADRFIFYDDVNYIVRGWVNRNRVLVNNEPKWVTVPLQGASQNRKICDTFLDPSPQWRVRTLKTIKSAYGRAPFFEEVFPMVEGLIGHQAVNLSDYLTHQIIALARFMDLNTEFLQSSSRHSSIRSSGQQRILDICKAEGADTYVNAKGGRSLYSRESFEDTGIDLRFVTPRLAPHSVADKADGQYISDLSIIDALMQVGPHSMRPHLEAYDLASN